jgi:benzoyl-CoA reductase/2-hydroxyglutaryl-CoA dehydratase subunit BcrC/BadD/HgdB
VRADQRRAHRRAAPAGHAGLLQQYLRNRPQMVRNSGALLSWCRCFILDTPICHTGFSREAKKYVVQQLEAYFEFLEGHVGKKFDYDRLEEVGRLSLEAQRMWQAVLDTTLHKPSPMSAFDAFIHLALIVTLRGTQETVDYYKTLLDEMNERVQKGISAVPRERYRLLWDNIPVWFKTRWLSEKFASLDACLVADTYTSSWSGMMSYIDEEKFMASLAETYTRIYLNIGVDEMAKSVLGMIDKYDVDGVVLHSNRSCKPYSLGQYDTQRIIQEKTGLPTLMIEADIVDERSFSESQIETRIDAFMEVVAAK